MPRTAVTSPTPLYFVRPATTERSALERCKFGAQHSYMSGRTDRAGAQMARRMILLLLTVIATAPHPAHGQAAAPLQVAGCYAVSIGLWSPVLGANAPLHAIPRS